MVHLGIVIKARAILEFRPILEALIAQEVAARTA
jgi:hypothetical protein